jgi:peptidyl-dipeptidase Dcp
LDHARAEIRAITESAEQPTFANTIEAYERVGADIDRVLGVYYPLLSADATEELMDLSLHISKVMSQYSSDVVLNRELFSRIKQVYDRRDMLSLTPEQEMLLHEVYTGFVRSGANLEGKDREEYRTLKQRLSLLSTKFSENVKRELATYKIYLTADDLAGLPATTVEQARAAAEADGNADGEYLFTLEQPVYTAFMRYSERRDLRERMYRLYNGRNIRGEYSNLDIMREIADLRLRLARLLGCKTFADYKLQHTMAETPARVYALLNRLREAYRPALEREMADLRELAGHDIAPWDYSFYSNRLARARYNFDPEAMRPYLELSRVVEGVFGLAGRLYGVKFTERPDVETYHPDVKAWEVTDADGSLLGWLYTDFFPRAGRKSPGAWMTDFREARGSEVRPLVNIVMNFTKPTPQKPSLLTAGEVSTFLHEFGHALHSLLTRAHYQSLAGTNVYRDFVELPSQFNENFLYEREFLDSFARHYQSGKPLPQELVDSLIASSQFGAAYACMRQLNFGFLDMAWHTITAPVTDPVEFERLAIKPVEIFEPIDDCLISPQFSHIFAGGYAAGYYSYKWAEVLDADAFAEFKRCGVFNPEVAARFRRNILAPGGTCHPAELYRRFRGSDPDIVALLHRDGISC